jgi:hypothetical protein
MNLAEELTRSEPASSRPKLSSKQKFAIALFHNWGELFEHLQAEEGGVLSVEPRGLIGLQHLWPPERRFDLHRFDSLGAATGFKLENPRQTVFCSGELVRSVASELVGAGCCSLTDILEHWVTPIEAERLGRAVSRGYLLLWTSANPQD